MASHESIHSSLKIHNLSTVSPSPSPTQKVLLPLTFFDLLWLRFHPVERLFFYSLPHLQSSHFFDSILPKLKHSLSLTLHHFLPLSGRLLWPSHSSKPFIQFTPGDSVSVIVAISDSDFNIFLQDSPKDASLSRPLIPHLDSSDSSASIFSLQITLFPNSGFCIGISTHHAVFDGKSSTMFMKAWAYLCKQVESKSSSSLLPQKLEPFFDREAITEPYSSLADSYVKGWMLITNNNQPSLKIMHEALFSPNIGQSTRATFHLTRGDIEKIKKRVLEKWDQESSSKPPNPPSSLSTFVVTMAYSWFCAAKAIAKIETKPKKFRFGFTVDCRGRLKDSVPENYFGNCVMGHVATELFSEEDGVVVVAKILHNTIREILEEKGVLDGADTLFSRAASLQSEGVQIIGVAGSTRFGVYGSDFGWGRPEKVEITSVDRNLTIGMAESKAGNGGVELGIVLNQHVMDCFATLFHSEKESL